MYQIGENRFFRKLIKYIKYKIIKYDTNGVVGFEKSFLDFTMSVYTFNTSLCVAFNTSLKLQKTQICMDLYKFFDPRYHYS